MTKIWTKEQRENIYNICDNLINSKYTNLEIRQAIEDGFDYAVDAFISYETEDQPVFASTRISILSDDIMEMDSITEEEKLQSIDELVEQFKPELIILAKQVKAKLKEQEEQFFKEANENQYCKKLIKDM